MIPRALDFSRHARNNMRLYAITEDDVAAVLAKPERITPTEKGRQNAWVRFWVERTRTEWLSVTFIQEGPDTVVITVTPRRRGLEGS